ncbi:MAG: dockerin type I repeat-containing protein [Prevotella sp.]|nr:dockerin type I repeat-containing protein [Prevotella sp.]
MKRKRFTLLRTALTLSAAFLVTTGSNANPIDITFSARGEASNVETVTVTNLTHTDIKEVTLSGTAVLQLIDPDELVVGDVNADSKVDVADIATVLSVMSGNSLDKEKASDVNSDQKVDVADIASILSIMAGNKPSSARFALGRKAAPKPAAGANVVTMDYHPGDILRFEGTSGEMRTIVVNVPERSHSLPFYFYPCVDVSGNNYPIIEAGGLMWMAEDLHAMQKLDGVSFYYDDETAD